MIKTCLVEALKRKIYKLNMFLNNFKVNFYFFKIEMIWKHVLSISLQIIQVWNQAPTSITPS